MDECLVFQLNGIEFVLLSGDNVRAIESRIRALDKDADELFELIERLDKKLHWMASKIEKRLDRKLEVLQERIEGTVRH